MTKKDVKAEDKKQENDVVDDQVDKPETLQEAYKKAPKIIADYISKLEQERAALTVIVEKKDRIIKKLLNSLVD